MPSRLPLRRRVTEPDRSRGRDNPSGGYVQAAPIHGSWRVAGLSCGNIMRQQPDCPPDGIAGATVNDEEPTVSDRVVRIAGASACEFDSPIAVPQLLAHGEHIDYLMCDELAELNVATMAGAGKSVIGLAAEEAGFARSFVDFQVGPYLPELLANGTKVLANA